MFDGPVSASLQLRLTGKVSGIPVGAGAARGIGAGRPEGGHDRPAIGAAGEETRAPMGNWKGPGQISPGQVKGGKRHEPSSGPTRPVVLRVVANNTGLIRTKRSMPMLWVVR